jgi:serine protease inhibitor
MMRIHWTAASSPARQIAAMRAAVRTALAGCAARTGRASVIAALAVSATATLVAGCGSRPSDQLVLPGEMRGVAAFEPAASPRPYAAADTAFGLDLLRAWCGQHPAANIVLSPASLANGLGMAYLGARGSTASAMAAVLHLPSSGSLEAGLHARASALGRLDGPGVTVADADWIWADPRLLPSRSYLNAVATSYGAGVGRAPLLTRPVQAARQIDAAIAAATRGHITRLLSAQAVQNAVFVLTDALYLKAEWATPFQPSSTTAGQFTTATGQLVRAHFLTGGELTSATANGWTAVSLPYQGDRLSMTALLPPAGSAGCPELTAPELAGITAKLASPHAAPGSAIALPEINLTNQASLDGLLGKLGMGVAFSQDADFAGISPQAGTIGSVVQGATLKVDAQGTVASAATAVTILPSAARVSGPTVVFNRPYLLLVTAAATGEPLFLARIANPDLP